MSNGFLELMQRGFRIACKSLAIWIFFGAGQLHAGELFRLSRTTVSDALCGTNNFDLSPDGRYIAAWAARGGVASSPPTLALLDFDCLFESSFAQRCLIAAYDSTAPVRQAVWSADSRSIVTLAPEVEFREFKAPGFLASDDAVLELKSSIFTEDLHLSGYSSLEAIRRSWEPLQREARAASSTARVIDAPISAVNLTADGLYRRNQDFRPLLRTGSKWRDLPVSAAAGASTPRKPRLLKLGARRFMLVAGELIDVFSGAVVARGDSFKLGPDGELQSVFDDLEAITELQIVDGAVRASRRKIDRRPDEGLLDWSRASKRDAQAYHYEAPFGAGRVEVQRDGVRRQLLCERRDGETFRVQIGVLNIGSKSHKLQATVFKRASPKGLVLLAPGGPGASSTGLARDVRAAPFLQEGWDVVVVTASGNVGAGLETVDRLRRDGGAAIDADAKAMLMAVEQGRIGAYRRVIFYGESYGGMVALAALRQSGANSRLIERFLLASPWLKPKPPSTWAGARGPVQAGVESQAKWEKAALGIDWDRPDDAFRTWARAQREAAPCTARVSIYYSRTDPTFEPEDLPCAASGAYELTAREKGSHMVILAGVRPWIRNELAK